MPWSTVLDNVRLPLRLRGASASACRARAEQVLERVGLKEALALYPRELSGGMQMRVSIARALVTEPRILLMDEPFAALDEITRFKLNDDLLAWQEQSDLTVVFVTHSVYESVYLSDRIAVMAAKPGRIHEHLNVSFEQDRSAALRASPEYASYCQQVSSSLQLAMENSANA